jgi:gamma-glutamyl phosphate reductase
MQALPELSQLSHADKDELIKALWNQVQQLTAQVVAMQKADCRFARPTDA